MSVVDQVTALLVARYRLAPEAVTGQVPLCELPSDSLALEELRLALEDELDIDLEEEQLTSRSTVQELWDAVGALTAVR
ncbi:MULTISPECIES: phosphopantetheine-binding protein [unclassified Streptomyces]|uniref:phosphopantetheine-binding protein n=1 Tax=Streptomyces TaxID=1883 RepID=UPI00136F7636|nr:MULTISPECIES: phosphopantetheine-binding protein [unclassified Streptomyces]NDZ99423.1 acyl carrier protein [Streptomyces sp. SID10116]MYY80099.1 acyl carrier protein [Streptomyces sp. SID335]MYZ11850.1 acyl carrier protein [Streptomyces sp. SID337]NDZ85315.1 acyl carrier protein [Streptomyces sp. SID10115]NEB46575.1 acyl carrier protein [Streptomyces sp. SID339]